MFYAKIRLTKLRLMRCLIRAKININGDKNLQSSFTVFNKKISRKSSKASEPVSSQNQTSEPTEVAAQTVPQHTAEQTQSGSSNIQSKNKLSESTKSKNNSNPEIEKTNEENKDDKKSYEEEIIDLFRRLGYEPISNITNESPEVERVFNNVPDEIKDEELPRLIFTSYASEGQLHFVVCAIQHDTLHIRAQAETFQRIVRFCEEIYKRTPSFLPRQWNRIRSRKTLQLKQIIDVLEPRQHMATIKGKIVGGFISGLFETFKEVQVNFWLTFAGLIVLSALYWKDPAIDFLTAPIFPAVILFIATNVVPIITTYVRYLNNRPIDWKNTNKDSF